MINGHKNWKEVSEDELNIAIAKNIYGNEIQNITHIGLGMLLLTINDDHKRVNYCNSGADMWPLIYQNKIHIECLNRHVSCEKWTARSFFSAYTHECENPLRAAAIVYLMINGIND